MAQFVLVVNDVSTVNFEKAMEVKIKSDKKVRFVPQGVPVNQGPVASHPMSTAQAQPNAPETINNVRFEWDSDGHEFGAEIVSALASHHHHHEEGH